MKPPSPYPLAVALGAGWRWLWDSPRDTTVILHRSGLWFEVTTEAVMGIGAADAAVLAAAIYAAVAAGKVGHHGIEVTRRGEDISAIVVPA